jgi:uncharacterized protein DUF3105
MSSRREEKERRRQERLEREAVEARAKQRRQRLYLVGGVIVAAGVIVAGAIAVAMSGGGDDGKGPRGNDNRKTVPIPAQQEKNLQAAAKAAGCTLKDLPNFGREHTDSKVQYKSNPPTSGPHNPQYASDGIYDPGNSPGPGNWVHALEHGRIVIQYRKGIDARRRSQLETLFKEPGANNRPGQYNQLLIENNTNMPYAVAASAWMHFIGCPTFNDKVFDALRAFRDAYTDKAPELVQQPE